jgi:hypothetical protein
MVQENGVLTTLIILKTIALENVKIVDISGTMIQTINTVVGMILNAPTIKNLLLNLINEV